MTTVWTTDDWARLIAALPTSGPLPVRLVLVPNGRVAHALRARLIANGDARALLGTRFVPPAVLAAEVLAAAAVVARPGEERRRPARVLACFRRGLPLAHFALDALRTRPGWDDAFAAAITDLESAGLRPDAVPAGNAQLADVVAVWRALDADAGTSFTTARTLTEAAALLSTGRGTGAIDGVPLAVVSGHASGAEVAFLRALPGAQLALLGVRPLRRTYVQRVTALFDAYVAAGLDAARPSPAAATERDLVATYFLAPPDVLADSKRPISRGPDGTVALEEHAGVDAELEAAASWVHEELTTHGTPLHALAILCPSADPTVGLLAERLAPLPVFVAGGVPLQQTAAGARLLALLHALREHLSVASVAALLPYLRTATDDHLSHGRALELAYSLGTVGGSPADPRGALAWRPRLAACTRRVREQLVATEGLTGDERGSLLRANEAYRRLLGELESATPALEALVDLAAAVLDGNPLAALGASFCAFVDRWLRAAKDGHLVAAQLPALVEELTLDDASVAGVDALEVLADAIADLRVPVGRMGDPAVYVGTLAGAVGLTFRAVRVLGLAEGTVPSAPREDPVLPDALRATCPRVVTSAERALAGTHALDWAVRAATARVVLSAPRAGLDGSVREPSSVLLEAAAAIRRPDASTGAPATAIPDLRALHRDAFAPARDAARAQRERAPHDAAAWLDVVASGGLALPDSWRRRESLALDRLRTLADPTRPADPLDGLFGKSAALGPMMGLDPTRPISAYRLRDLLVCPHQFLFSSLLGWSSPAEASAQGELDHLTFGSVVHAIAEEFGRAHGTAFGDRDGSLADWQAKGRALADQHFDALMEEYPLLGDGVRAQQRERVRRQVADFLEYDWAGKPRRFHAVERSFGFDPPFELMVGKRSLYVRGSIDRIDVEQGKTVIRDLKTGRAHPRRGKETDPDPGRDLQLGLYGLVVKAHAKAWKLPASIQAAYVHPGEGADTERAFRDDHDALEARATEWLELAAGLLAERAFPRTPDKDDCKFCDFRVVCGPGAHARADQTLTATKGPLAALRALKVPT